MKIDFQSLEALAKQLEAERKRQGLSRSQASAVCNVSESFIRDAESNPAKCSLGIMLKLVNGLGLTVNVTGWQEEDEKTKED
jgi:ribosome-binding protein aMBF1 (putative translation factor)